MGIKKEILKDEYIALLQVIDSFDTKTLKIKTWSITTTLSAFAAAFVTKIPEIFLLAAASSLIFWIIEYLWKKFQDNYFERFKEIEEYMRGETENIPLLQTSNRWERSNSNMDLKKFRTLFFYSNVFMPHLYELTLSILIYYLLTFHYITL